MNILLSIFSWVLYSSAMGGFLAVIILFLKLLMKKMLGVRWHYCIWFLIIIRLLIPYAPKSPFSIFNLVDSINSGLNPSSANVVTVLNDGILLSEMQNDPIMLQDDSLKNSTLSEMEPNNHYIPRYYLMIACFIWLSGVILLGLFVLSKMLVFLRKIRRQQVCTDESILNLIIQAKERIGFAGKIITVHTDLVTTPAVFGFINPRLLLPWGFENRLTHDELRYIIFHEMAHLKRKDVAVSCIARILNILHWFNPILWYTFYCMRQEGELACDALALSFLGPNENRKYGETIIKLVESFSKHKHVYGMTGIIEKKSQIKRRITMISLFSKNSYKWSAASVLIFLLVGCIMLTNAKGAANAGTSEAILQEIKQTYGINEQEHYRNGDTWDSIRNSNDSLEEKSDNEKKALKEIHDFEHEWGKAFDRQSSPLQTSFQYQGNTSLTEQQLQSKAKVEERLESVWQDIKKTHKINESQYVTLDTTEKFNLFLSGKLDGFTDKDLIDQMNKIFQKNLIIFPLGSTKPRILLNKDCQEIVFANKNNDGSDILQVFSKLDTDMEFSKEVLIKEGAPIPEIH